MSARKSLGRQFLIAEVETNPEEPGSRPTHHSLVAYAHGVGPSYSERLGPNEAGLLTYEDKGTHLEIGRRATSPYRIRQGIATALQDAVQQRAGDRPIISHEGDMTDDAHWFHEAYKRKRPESTWVVRDGAVGDRT